MWRTPDDSEAALVHTTAMIPDERPKKKLCCRSVVSNTGDCKEHAEPIADVAPSACSHRSFTVTAGVPASAAAVCRGVPMSPITRFSAILGLWWSRMMRSFAAFARPGTPAFLIHDPQLWRAHVLHHPTVFSGLDNCRPFLLERCLASDMPRFTAHLRGASSAFADAGLGPDPTGLFHHFLARSETNSYLEPAAWLIVFALVDKLYLEHFSIYNSLSSAPKGNQVVRWAGVAAFGTRFYAGHTIRNLFVLFAMAHKWHGEHYFTLKYFQEQLPKGLRRSSQPSGATPAAAASGTSSAQTHGLNPLLPSNVAARHASSSSSAAFPQQQEHQAVEPVELAGIEEGFLRLLDHNLSVTPQAILRLADYFLSPDEKEFVVSYVAKSSIQKKWTVLMA